MEQSHASGATDEEARREKTGAFAEVWAWVKSRAPALTLVGLALYIFMRLGAELFLNRLGFTPEDVGLGYAEMLGRAISPLLGILVVSAVVSIAFLFVLPPVLRYWYRLSGQSAKEGTLSDRMERLRSRVVVLVIFIFVVLPPFSAWYGAGSAEEGIPITAEWPNYPWRAEPALIHWLDRSHIHPIAEGQCVLYLGQADGFVALYDPTGEGSSWRLPEGAVAIETGGELQDVEKVPAGCA